MLPATSQAGIVFTQGSVTTSTNIGAYSALTSTTADGFALGSGDLVLQVTTNTALTVPASGAARVEAASTLFTTYVITPKGTATGFSVIELNPLNETLTGTFKLEAIDQFGNVFTSGDFTLGNGENRTASVDDNGTTVIKKLTLTASGALVHDVRQVRVTLAEDSTTNAVPAPAGVLLGLAGAGSFGGFAGLGWLRRRFGRN